MIIKMGKMKLFVHLSVKRVHPFSLYCKHSERLIAVCFLLLLLHFVGVQMVENKSIIPGHRRPFGSHMKPMGVTAIGKFSSPVVFYGHFVKSKKPIHMKSALKEAKHSGMEEWTDDYFRNYFGMNMVRVEIGKKEVRGRKATWTRFNDFLEAYPYSGLYMVHSINGAMQSLVQIPVTLQCGGFQRALHEAVIWMGRGPLQSVLHYDELDNLLCVFDGTKDIVLIDQLYKDKVEAKGFDPVGHFSHVDMDSVDMHTFPQFENLPWYRVHMDPGDCLYIPNRWYHQVNTYGDRSLAVNIWFSHLWKFDDGDCRNVDGMQTLRPLDDFGFVSANEALRSKWLEAFEGTDEVDLESFIAIISSGSKDDKEKVFTIMDQDKDGLLSWDELYNFDITSTLLLYPMVFQESQKTKSSLEVHLPADSDARETMEKTSSVEKKESLEKCSQSSDKKCTKNPKQEKEKWTSQQKIKSHEEL